MFKVRTVYFIKLFKDYSKSKVTDICCPTNSKIYTIKHLAANVYWPWLHIVKFKTSFKNHNSNLVAFAYR